eukprot:m.242967 g.242967  ORF g.242967 m.242967 type:complete len:81 (+) comp14136_c0_seq1:3-245(+)
MTTDCQTLREQLEFCLSHSECMVIHKKSANECLKKDTPGVSESCRAYAQSLFECKRGMMDNRNRFRGNKYFETKKYSSEE